MMIRSRTLKTFVSLFINNLMNNININVVLKQVSNKVSINALDPDLDNLI